MKYTTLRDLKQQLGDWGNTMFFSVDENKQPVGQCIRVWKAGIHYEITRTAFGDKSINDRLDDFLQKERGRSDKFLIRFFEDEDEMWRLVQKFATKNNMLPFTDGNYP